MTIPPLLPVRCESDSAQARFVDSRSRHDNVSERVRPGDDIELTWLGGPASARPMLEGPTPDGHLGGDPLPRPCLYWYESRQPPDGRSTAEFGRLG